MEETNWSSDFYSNIFSLDFDSLFNTIDLESIGSKKKKKENRDTVPGVLNTTNRESERAVLADLKQQTTYQHQTSPSFHLLPLTKSKKQLKKPKIRTQKEVQIRG